MSLNHSITPSKHIFYVNCGINGVQHCSVKISSNILIYAYAYINTFATTIPHTISKAYLCVSIVSLHHKWNRARLSSPDIDLRKWGNFRKIWKLSTCLVPNLFSEYKNLATMQENWYKSAFKLFVKVLLWKICVVTWSQHILWGIVDTIT